MDKFYLFASLSRGGCGQWTGYYNVDSWSPLRSDRSHCRPDWGSSLCLIQPETLLIILFISIIIVDITKCQRTAERRRVM